MPRSRRPTAYGPEYEQLLLRSFTESANGDFTLQMDSPNAAASLRAKIYAYFSALRKSSPDSDSVQMCNRLSLRCAGSALVIFRSEDSWDARALRNALGLEEGFADVGGSTGVIAPSSPNLEKLREIRSKNSVKE